MSKAIQAIRSRSQCILPALSWPELTGRFRLLHLFLLLYCFYAIVIRLALMVQSWSHISHSPLTILAIFGTGLFYDLVSGLYYTIPLVLYLILLPSRIFTSRWHRPLVYLLFFCAIYAQGFGAVAEWLFWKEFGARLNFIAVDYLVYTHEVVGNILESYPIPLLLSGIFVVTAMVFLASRRAIDNALHLEKKERFRKRLAGGLVYLLLPLLSFLMVNDSLAGIFSNHYEQELSKNGLYQLFAAFRNNILDYGTFYKTMNESEVYTGLHQLLHTRNSTYLHDSPSDVTRLITNPGPEERHNVVLIMVESLSARFLGVFGNQKGLTPNLDRLARQSLLFTNLYATGTRTVRGMEAVTLSVPPTPGRSIVKRPGNDDMFSLGFLFKQRGYDTKFLYGGYGYFDNMNYFFSHNGFSIVDRTSLSGKEITFANIWGVCDEDILKRATREFDESYKKGKPFFGYVMTTSNHRPFTYPDGKIDIPSHTGRIGGVKYTDYAINNFIKEARRHPWFDNTIFIIVADHCAGSAGRQELPVNRYHIPLLFYAPKIIKPGVNDSLASQVDLSPTLLGLLHWTYRSKFFGKDILQADFTPRAFIGNYQKLGYLKDGDLTILTDRKAVHQYAIGKKILQDAPLRKINDRKDLAQEAICLYQGASLLYKNRLDRWKGGLKANLASSGKGVNQSR